MGKHTSGPWKAWDTGNGMGITPEWAENAHLVPNVGAFALEICRVKADPSLGGPAWDAHWEEQKANARLIAAAPDLKMELGVAAQSLEAVAQMYRDQGNQTMWEHYHGKAVQARKAIAKAEGR